MSLFCNVSKELYVFDLVAVSAMHASGSEMCCSNRPKVFPSYHGWAHASLTICAVLSCPYSSAICCLDSD